MKNYFFDMDGTLALYHRWVYTSTKEEPWWAKIAGTHYYATLPPHTKMVEFVRQRLQEHPQSVYILTSIGVTEAAAYYEHTADKICWVQEHLPELLPDHFLVVAAKRPEQGQVTKSMVAEQTLGRPLCLDDLLYDDFNPNLQEWKQAGGTPIKVLNGINHKCPDMDWFDIRF